MKKRNIIILSCLVFIIVALIVIATIFDLQISLALADLQPNQYYTSNIFAIIFEVIGETFLYLFLAFAFAVIFWWANQFLNQKKVVKIILETITIILIFAVFMFFLSRMIGYISNYQTVEISGYFFILYVFLSLILSVLTILACKLIPKSALKRCLIFALIIICVALVSNLITQLIKGNVFGRMRFRAMNSIDDFSAYAPWFVLNGTSLRGQFPLLLEDAFKSFPSGHTTAVAITFTLYALPFLFKIFQKKIAKIFCITAPIILTSLVALSRIIAGAHFLSDVLFGALITFITTLIFMFIFIKKVLLKLDNSFMGKTNKIF